MPRIVGNTRISRNALINTSIDGVLESCQPRQKEREREREIEREGKGQVMEHRGAGNY